MTKDKTKLYRCCLTCIFIDNYHWSGCKNGKNCFNGFSAYSPNEEIKKLEKENNIKQEA